jgi:DNA invertase Pin-like site-specific DNA recombinase
MPKRVRLDGKNVTEEQISSEIYNLIHGVGEKPYPLTVIETAKFLGIDVHTVYTYMHKMQIRKEHN